jgi:hypothetical protein
VQARLRSIYPARTAGDRKLYRHETTGREVLGGSHHECVFGGPSGRDLTCCAESAPFPCGVSDMPEPSPDLVAADLAKLINPGLRSPRTQLEVLPDMMIVQAELAGGAASLADAIEAVVNKGMVAMSASSGEGMPRLAAADPVKALRAALALRPGSERVKSSNRRTAAARAMGLLSGDGWRAHHEKALLHALAGVICSLDTSAPGAGRRASVSAPAGADSGIARFYSDFVDIKDDWENLFASSSTLDLAIMYGATWRNTYRKQLNALAARPDGRIRVVLPEPARDSPLVALYAHSLRIAPDDFCLKITEAVRDFRSIGPRRHVEVYLTAAVCRHAIYLFTHQAILALYSLCGERIPTPALLASEGGLLSFMRQDFDRLLEQSDRVS